MSKKDAAAVLENLPVEAKPFLPVDMSMFEDDAGKGFEEADKDAYAIPFLVVLQSGSPQCKRSDGAYVEGAQEGDLFNTVTQQVVKQPVQLIPCHFMRRFIRWGPRKAGGGFKGEFLPTDPVVAQAINHDGLMLIPLASGELDRDKCDLMMDTRSHYVLVLTEDGAFTPAIVALSSTQLKKSKNWMSKMDGIKLTNGKTGALYTPPMFSQVYQATTVPESNDKGSWFGWKIERVGPVESAPLYAAAKAFREAVIAGKVKAQEPAPDGETKSGNGFEDDEKDIPF